jgi:Ribonuclease G/E
MFGKFAADNFSVPLSNSGIQKSKKAIEKTLKAEIARQIWLEEGYFLIVNQTDREVQIVLNDISK